MKNFLSIIFLLFTTYIFSQCTHTIRLTDTFGDGWNGGSVSVSVNGITVLTNITLASGLGPANFNFTANTGQTIRVWRTAAGTYPGEMRVQIVNNVSTVLLATVQPVTGTTTTGGSTCVASCSVPSCTNSTAYGSAVAPTTPTPVTISTCNYQSEYSTITGIVSGRTYQFGYTLSGIQSGHITVRSGTFNGPVVAQGNAPLNWSSTYTGTVYVHYNTNSTCGTASSCGTSTITCLSCTAPAAPANDLVCNATAITCGQTISGTTVNATNSGTAENSTCTISQTMPGVWYRITGNGQVMTASLCATSWDSKISIFSGSSCSSLTCVGGNDDAGPTCTGTSASYSWTSVNGVNYYILVHGFSINSAFNISLTCSTPPPANPTSISASSLTICSGQSTTLTANGAVGTVYWYSGDCGVTQIGTGNSIVVSPTSTQTYWARNFNNSLFSTGCASTTVTVNPTPIVGISANPSVICEGNSTQLVSSVNGISSPGSLVVTISGTSWLDETSWSLTNSLGTLIGSGSAYATGSTNVINITNSQNGPYQFVLETQGAINDNVANYQITCNGQTIFSGTLNGGLSFSQSINSCLTTPATTFSWSPTTSLTNPNAQSPFASPATSTTYQLTATANGCSGSSSLLITVNPSVGQVSNITGNSNIISGTQETYSITPVAGTVTYQWSYTESTTAPLWINIPGSNSPSVTFTWPQTTTDGAVRVTVSNSFDCGTQQKIFLITTSTALPVELVSFDGNCQNETITLNWITASEHNSDYFSILKSRDGQLWSELTKVESAGNSTQLISYSIVDDNVYNGNTYYKLIQFDIDGQSKEYGPINVACQSIDNYFTVFPNPNSGQFQILLNNKNLTGDCSMTIKDTKGSNILNKSIIVKPGVNAIYVEIEKSSPGIYYLYISNDVENTNVIKVEIK